MVMAKLSGTRYENVAFSVSIISVVNCLIQAEAIDYSIPCKILSKVVERHSAQESQKSFYKEENSYS